MTVGINELQRAIGDRTVTQAAQDWGIPRWVLYDVLRGATRCPQGRYIPGIAKGMNRTVEEVIELFNDGERSPAKEQVA